MGSVKVAIICDWLTNMGGAEKTVLAMHKAFPEAPIYTSVFDPERCPEFAELDIRTTWLQKLPRRLRYRHQLWPVLRSFAFKRLDLSEYDVVLSSASAEAKAVQAAPGATHVCYCHTPTRYYWSNYHEYLQRPGFGPLDPLVRLIMPTFVRWMRRRDLAAVRGVDEFIANSHEVQDRIQKYYHRPSRVVFPPVETERMQPKGQIKKGDYYVMVGRQIPYKRFDIGIAACNALQKKLLIIGSGSEHEKLKAMAGPSVTFLTGIADDEKAGYVQRAKALLFPGREDFGITPVEALAAGTPVIAYGAGGVLDYVKDGDNGILFFEQTASALQEAIESFERQRFNAHAVQKSALPFREERFIDELRQAVRRP